MATFLLPFLVLATIGLILSLVTHAAALLGIPQPLGPAAWGLHVGVFVVWLPAILAYNRLAAGSKRQNSWKVALLEVPCGCGG